jgi:hypothetical protein
MGRGGYQRLLAERKALVPHFRAGLEKVAGRHGERLLHCPHNTISFAITLQVWRAVENLCPRLIVMHCMEAGPAS